MTEDELREVMEADCVLTPGDLDLHSYEDLLAAGIAAGLTARQADRMAYELTHELDYEPNEDD